MEIGKSIRFIPQQRQWPGGCAPPRSRPGAHPEVPRLAAAAQQKKTPASPEALLPAPRYTHCAWQYICVQFELPRAAGRRRCKFGAYGSHGPQAHCRCWHAHVRAAMSPRRPARTRPCAYGDVGVTRSVKIFLDIVLNANLDH